MMERAKRSERRAMDVEKIKAIDVHTHAETSRERPDKKHIFAETAEKYFGEGMTPNAWDVADYYRKLEMAAVVFTVDMEPKTAQERVPNEEILQAARENPDVLIPFASIHPARGAMGVKEAKHLIEEGVRGFKFHPNLQDFFPNDRMAYPLYEVIAEAGLPALFHTGHSGMGSGMRGGGGVRLKYSNPMYVDDVAVDFPDMKIILAHPSFPWQDEALSVCLHKPNVFIDLSGWSPKYFPENLVRYANTLLKRKMLFGSDYPVIRPEKWMEDFEKAGFRDEVKPLILKQNAARLFGFDPDGS
jgi:predicted TIM-barrel fold metal-dependent hydrolase